MGKCTVLNNSCGARDSQLVSKIFAEGSGAQVPTMEEPEVKVGQSDVTQMFQFALEAKDMELNSLRHKIDGMENQLTMLAAKEEQLKALLDKCTEDLQEEREESKGTVFLYANLLKAAEAATAQAKAEAQEMAQVVAALPLTPARPSLAEGKKAEPCFLAFCISKCHLYGFSPLSFGLQKVQHFFLVILCREERRGRRKRRCR